MYEKLKHDTCQANIELQKQGLVIYSWGNVSGIDRDKGVIAIKPSGVAYDGLTPDKMVVLGLNGKILDKHYLRKHGNNAYYGQKF